MHALPTHAPVVIALDGTVPGPLPPFAVPEAAPADGPVALDLPGAADARAVAALLPRAVAIRIVFPGFADGRGFSLARRLRALGFGGRLRAAGALIPDQRGHARACGFDEIEIDPARLARHGAEAWSREAAQPPFRRRAAGG